MRSQGAIDCIEIVGRSVFRTQAFKPTHNAWGAETALTSAGCQQCIGPALPIFFGQSINGRDHTASDTANWRDTCDSRCAIDQHGAATTLTLRTASRFWRPISEPTAQCRQQRHAVVGNAHLFAVNDERDLRWFRWRGIGHATTVR
jgi:hypothetical protein